MAVQECVQEHMSGVLVCVLATLDSITSQEHTLSEHFCCWVRSTRVVLTVSLYMLCLMISSKVRKQSCWTRQFTARLRNCPYELLCVAQPPCAEMHFSLVCNIANIETCRPPTLPLTNPIEVWPSPPNNTFLSKAERSLLCSSLFARTPRLLTLPKWESWLQSQRQW